MFLGHVFEGGGCGMGPWQKLVEAAIGMSVDNLRDGLGEISVGIDVGELAGLDQRSDHSPVLGTSVGTREQSILAIEGDRSDRALNDVGVDLDTAVVDEAAEPVPA